MSTIAEITHAPVGSLKLDEANPRTNIDKDALGSLIASIEKRGIIQPLLVRPDGNGGYLIVAGQRRYLAAVAAGLDDVPVYVRDVDGEAGTLGVVENLEREQLTPIEEAHAFRRAVDAGMTIADLAQAITRSEQLVKDRLALLELPAKVHALVDKGTLTLRAATALPKLAAAGEAVLVKAAEMIGGEGGDPWGDPVTVEHLEKQPGDVVEWALEELDAEAPFMVEVIKGAAPQLDRIPWPDGVGINGKAFVEMSKKLPERGPDYSNPRGDALKITQADIDAARAYGCLLEFDDNGTTRGYRRRAGWITDPAWLADRIDQKLTKAIKSQERKQKTAAKKAGVDVPAGADGETARKAAVRAENAAKRAATLAARERNITLGIALYKELHAPAVTADAMRTVAEVIFTYAGEDIGRRGLRYVDENCHAVETKNNGEIKSVKYPKSFEQTRKLLRDRLDRAQTPEQILGVILQGLVAAKFADVEAAPSNDRHGEVRGLGDRWGYARNPRLEELVEKLAEPVLPPAVAEQIREQRAVRAQEVQEEVAREIASVREGVQTCPNCGAGRDPEHPAGCECTDEEIAAAIDACPRCGEEGCFATCSSFDVEATVE